jgi:hypothetical protein
MAAKRTGGSQVTLEEFTEVTLAAVARAIDRRKGPKIIPGPIIFGIIWWPEGGPINPQTPIAK